jgi:predicted ester cyclase
MGNLRSVVEQHYRDMNDHAFERTRSLFADDVTTTMPGGPPMQGIEPFMQAGDMFQRAFPDMHVELRGCVEQGDTVIAEAVITGTQAGPLATPGGREIPPTNKRIDLIVADAFDVKNGKVTGHRVYFDQMAMMMQLGLVPEGATT